MMRSSSSNDNLFLVRSAPTTPLSGEYVGYGSFKYSGTMGMAPYTPQLLGDKKKGCADHGAGWAHWTADGLHEKRRGDQPLAASPPRSPSPCVPRPSAVTPPLTREKRMSKRQPIAQSPFDGGLINRTSDLTKEQAAKHWNARSWTAMDLARPRRVPLRRHA